MLAHASATASISVVLISLIFIRQVPLGIQRVRLTHGVLRDRDTPGGVQEEGLSGVADPSKKMF